MTGMHLACAVSRLGAWEEHLIPEPKPKSGFLNVRQIGIVMIVSVITAFVGCGGGFLAIAYFTTTRSSPLWRAF